MWFSLSLLLSGACHEDVAASIRRRHAVIARRLAVARPKLSGRRSSSTVLSQVCFCLPVLRRQSLGGPRMQVRRAREWSWPMSARHRWPKKDKRRWRMVYLTGAAVPYVTKMWLLGINAGKFFRQILYSCLAGFSPPMCCFCVKLRLRNWHKAKR